MRAPPLTELYDLLRAEGFTIGIDDHIRIGRLLEHDAEWTAELLHAAVAALVVVASEDRGKFDACWERWLLGAEPLRAGVAHRPSAGTETSREGVVEAPGLRTEAPRTVRRVRASGAALFAAVFATVVAVLVVRYCAIGERGKPALQVTKSLAGSGSEASSKTAGSALAATADDTAGEPTTVVLGVSILAIAAVIAGLRIRARRRFVSGPWRYVFPVPSAVRPIVPRNAIDDAAADLTWQASGAEHEVDVRRSVIATVERAGLPTLIHRQVTAAPRYLVLEDTAGGAARWRPIYDELLAGLMREGVELERYTFTANLEHCFRPDGNAASLADLIDHVDALMVIGDGEAAVNPLDSSRAAWVASLGHIPRRLWINPVPPVRWTAGARTIAEDTPMEHGVARALTGLHAGAERRGPTARPYPAVIERAPGTASAVVALRMALGQPAFQVVAATAVAGPPTIAAARWLADSLAVELDEQDWLAIAALPWFNADDWPDGLRERLDQALAADAPGIADSVRAISDGLLAASAPPPDSAAHLAWQLEGARRTAQRGDHMTALQLLRKLAATPLAHQARSMRRELGLLDRTSPMRAWFVITVPIAAIVAAFGLLVVAAAWSGVSHWLDGPGALASTLALVVRMSLVGLAITLLVIGVRKLWKNRSSRALYGLQSTQRRKSPTDKTGLLKINDSNTSDAELTSSPKDRHESTGQLRWSEVDEIPSQYKIGSTRRRWFTYIISGLIAVSVAGGVTFLIIRITRDATPTTGSVRVSSVPAGADVMFDGTLLGDRTPLTIDGVPVGTGHKVEVSLRHYQRYTEEVSIPKTGGTIQMLAQLTSQIGKIVINTTPGGAQIWINGQLRGTTPTTLSSIDIESTPSIELLHKDFGRYTVPLKWEAAGVAYVDYRFSH